MRKSKTLMAVVGGLAILLSFLNGAYFHLDYYVLAILFAVSFFVCVVDRTSLGIKGMGAAGPSSGSGKKRKSSGGKKQSANKPQNKSKEIKQEEKDSKDNTSKEIEPKEKDSKEKNSKETGQANKKNNKGRKSGNTRSYQKKTDDKQKKDEIKEDGAVAKKNSFIDDDIIDLDKEELEENIEETSEIKEEVKEAEEKVEKTEENETSEEKIEENSEEEPNPEDEPEENLEEEEDTISEVEVAMSPEPSTEEDDHTQNNNAGSFNIAGILTTAKDRILTYTKSSLLPFLAVVGGLSPIIILAQILLNFTSSLWNTGFVPAQGLTHALYALSIAFIIGALVEQVSGKHLFSLDTINNKSKVFFAMYAAAFFACMFVMQLSITYALAVIPNQQLLFETAKFLPIAIAVFVFAINYNQNGWLISLVLLVTTILTYYVLIRTSAVSVCIVYILAVGAVFFKDRIIVKLAFVSSALTLIISFVLSMTGVIHSEIYRSVDGLKHLFGFYNPNPASMIFAVTVISFLYLRKRNNIIGRILDLGIIAVTTIFIRYYAGGRTSVLGLAYLFAGTVIYDLCRFIPLSFRKKYNKAVAILNFVYAEAVLLVTAAFGIVFSYIYDKYNNDYLAFRLVGRVFNPKSFGERLSISHDAIEKYGINFFGLLPSRIEDGQDFSGMDVFYARAIVLYGIFILVCFLAFMTVYYYRLAKRGMYYKMFLLSTFSVMGITEALVGEIMYNVFPMLAFSRIDDRGYVEATATEQGEEVKEFAGDLFQSPVLPVLGIVVWFPLIPAVLSWLRTVVNGYVLSGAAALFIVLVMAAIAVFITWTTLRVVRSFISEKKIDRTQWLILARNALILVTGVVVCLYSNVSLREKLIDRISGTEELVRAISECSEGEVYVDNIPNAYDRKYTGIGKPVFYGDELAYYDNVALVTDAKNDYSAFFNMGFVYTPISDYDAVYSNDQSVITTLEESGYKFTGYCTYENVVNLPYEIWRNHLESTADGEAILYGPEHSLARGPFVETQLGSYVVSFDLYLDKYGYADVYPVVEYDEAEEKDDEENQKVCTLKLQGQYGEKFLNSKDVYEGDFDENGHLVYTMNFNGAGEGTEFFVIMEEGQGVLVNKITYTRTASVDKRRVVDARGNVIHEEYVDENGKPQMQAGGYYGYDAEYDGENRLVRQVYLDENNNPVNISDGYVERRIKYDKIGNAIEFTYYDVEGNATLVQGCYFLDKREYDSDRRLVRQTFHGSENEMVLTKGGYAGIDMQYDDANNVSSYLYLGMDLKPILLLGGYAEERREYNDKRQVIRFTYYDVNGKRVALQYGQSAIEREYDEAGNIAVEKYYGVNDERILYNGEYWKIFRVYNDKKQNIHEEYYDTDDQMMLLAGGYAGLNRKYTEAGDVSELTHLGLDGKPALNTSGYSIWRRKYNEKRQCIRLDFLDTEGKPVDVGGGRASEEYEYDENGNISSYTYFGLNGERIMLSGSWWRDYREYDKNRQLIHREFYDTDDKPIFVSGGYFSIDYEYDENGTWMTRKYYDFDGNLVTEEKNEN